MAKFSIEWGVPEMKAMREELQAKYDAEALDGDERVLLKKLQKTVLLLAENPAHPGSCWRSMFHPPPARRTADWRERQRSRRAKTGAPGIGKGSTSNTGGISQRIFQSYPPGIPRFTTARPVDCQASRGSLRLLPGHVT